MIQLSVIIPTFNRASQLMKCIQALQKQNFEYEWEVILVDDGGEQPLDDLANSFKSSLNIILIKQENQGPASARNLGANLAKGKFLAFLDDDCEPSASWLSQLSKHVKSGLMVGGRTKNKLIDNFYSEASQQLVSFLYQYFRDTPLYFFTSNNFALDKATFLKVGGFDETFVTSAGEDRAFCAKWRHSGYKMNYYPDVLIWHSHDLNLHSFWKMHFKYGKAATHFIKKIKLLGMKPMKPKLSFYQSLVIYVRTRTTNRFHRKTVLISLVLLSQVAVAFGVLNNKFSSHGSRH